MKGFYKGGVIRSRQLDEVVIIDFFLDKFRFRKDTHELIYQQGGGGAKRAMCANTTHSRKKS